jgi:uncharacterized membrane protein
LKHHVDWYKFTNVSEVCTASIIRAIIVTLVMVAVTTSEAYTSQHSSATQKTAIFILTAVRTSNNTKKHLPPSHF